MDKGIKVDTDNWGRWHGYSGLKGQMNIRINIFEIFFLYGDYEDCRLIGTTPYYFGLYGDCEEKSSAYPFGLH